MVRVKTLDISRSRRGPFVYDTGVAAVTSGLVGQLPGKDGRRGLVSAHDGGDVLLALIVDSAATKD